MFLRWPGGAKDGWALGRLLGWVAAGTFFFSGLTGIGLLSSVPQTVVMLITIGWFVTAPRARGLAVSRQIVPKPRRPPFVPVPRPGAEPSL